MRTHRDLIGFLDLASELLDLRQRIIEAQRAEQVVMIARDYGFFFSTDDLLASRQYLASEHWSWISETLLCGFWVES